MQTVQNTHVVQPHQFGRAVTGITQALAKSDAGPQTVATIVGGRPIVFVGEESTPQPTPMAKAQPARHATPHQPAKAAPRLMAKARALPQAVPLLFKRHLRIKAGPPLIDVSNLLAEMTRAQATPPLPQGA